ncbi:hypothetical protein B0F90DRAFT_1682979 [Multifurca ochricompacta]|uniref:Uncharacterized protein n=1 Tax=Multifurca ochricompacta TaxID=376703 RepID=A0AAD4QQN8_9AGAM|nr:hypothetical protein B0F90DRAFT_1682979 [Multifurca ochricompacta]
MAAITEQLSPCTQNTSLKLSPTAIIHPVHEKHTNSEVGPTSIKLPQAFRFPPPQKLDSGSLVVCRCTRG